MGTEEGIALGCSPWHEADNLNVSLTPSLTILNLACELQHSSDGQCNQWCDCVAERDNT